MEGDAMNWLLKIVERVFFPIALGIGMAWVLGLLVWGLWVLVR
jgi:hypothetical protein